MAEPAKLAFGANEEVLCFHGPLVYEAKLWDGKDGGATGPHYFVHYKGWKRNGVRAFLCARGRRGAHARGTPDGGADGRGRLPSFFPRSRALSRPRTVGAMRAFRGRRTLRCRWDEWVPESRVLKWTDTNLARQAQLKDVYTDTKRTAAPSKDRAAHDTGTDRGKKRPRDQSVERVDGVAEGAGQNAGPSWDDEVFKRVEVKLPIPDALKVRLVDDWEYVTKNQLLVPLPRVPNVVEILKMFAAHARAKDSGVTGASSNDPPDDTLNEVLDGLKLYFDTALGNILLYRFERQQYLDARREDEGKTMSEIYGAEHLLRLFGELSVVLRLDFNRLVSVVLTLQLPTLIVHTNMDPEAIKVLQSVFVEILRFMEQNAGSLMAAEYEAASPAYVALSQNN
ncbi:MAG: MRG-domain-containing protein [Olpidium bornovanus]|uniref:Chromatin modification-related protein EAF3 n=1 Tax=Olpidium bornovanus TaxID=278681 RepID=A0A8H8DJR9_9FUNG|nr:MAG: MRG-domain-containing protein [Olpidium bornovanus]